MAQSKHPSSNKKKHFLAFQGYFCPLRTASTTLWNVHKKVQCTCLHPPPRPATLKLMSTFKNKKPLVLQRPQRFTLQQMNMASWKSTFFILFPIRKILSWWIFHGFCWVYWSVTWNLLFVSNCKRISFLNLETIVFSNKQPLNFANKTHTLDHIHPIRVGMITYTINYQSVFKLWKSSVFDDQKKTNWRYFWTFNTPTKIQVFFELALVGQ